MVRGVPGAAGGRRQWCTGAGASLPDESPGGPPRRDHGGHDAPAGEEARYWRHAAVPGVDLLRATYVTHRYARHAHETYTLALIEDGVEEFRYGGSLDRKSTRL